jgi:hypothetical protein
VLQIRLLGGRRSGPLEQSGRRLHPPDCARMQRHRRAYLEPAGLTTVSTPNREWQTQRAATLGDEISERQYGPSITPVAISVQLVLVFEQAREVALAAGSLSEPDCCALLSEFFTDCCAAERGGEEYFGLMSGNYCDVVHICGLKRPTARAQGQIDNTRGTT